MEHESGKVVISSFRLLGTTGTINKRIVWDNFNGAWMKIKNNDNIHPGLFVFVWIYQHLLGFEFNFEFSKS